MLQNVKNMDIGFYPSVLMKVIRLVKCWSNIVLAFNSNQRLAKIFMKNLSELNKLLF